MLLNQTIDLLQQVQSAVGQALDDREIWIQASDTDESHITPHKKQSKRRVIQLQTYHQRLERLRPILAQASDAAATDLSAALFYLFALMSAASAIGVVASRNIVRTAVFLLFTLTGVAGLYFLLNAEFLAAVQLVVYAGGTLILIVFGVMLTSKSPFSKWTPARKCCAN